MTDLRQRRGSVVASAVAGDPPMRDRCRVIWLGRKGRAVGAYFPGRPACVRRFPALPSLSGRRVGGGPGGALARSAMRRKESGEDVRRRLFGMLAVLGVLLAVVPFAATAAAPDTGRISSTSYTDMAGYETNSLCGLSGDVGALAPAASIETTVSFSGTGANLGGSGTGTLTIYLYGDGMDFNGQLEINGETYSIYGGGDM